MSRYSVGSENLTSVEKPNKPNVLNLNRPNRKGFEQPKLPQKNTDEPLKENENSNAEEIKKKLRRKALMWIFSVIGGLAVVSVATGVGLGLSQNKSYNASCSKTSDCAKLSQYGLMCINNTCSCDPVSTYNGSSCVTGYFNGFCNSSLTCSSNIGLSCMNGKCQCTNSSKYGWSGFTCTIKNNYTQSCASSNDCDATLGFFCQTSAGSCNCPTASVVGYCDCPSNYYYNSNTGSCVVRFSNNQTCSYNYHCRGDLLLSCTNSTCQCSSLYYWNGSICTPKLSYQVTCASSSQCNDNILLSCPSSVGQCNCPVTSTANKCDCSSGYYWDYTISSCLIQNSYSGLCLNGTFQCKTTQNTVCKNNNCTCSSTNYWTGSICTAKLTYGTSCTTSYMCQDYLSPGLTCASNFCSCPTGYFWLTTRCVAAYTYQVACTSSIQCDSTKGLSCPTTAGQCNCPTSSTAYKCDCSSGYYWDYTSSSCLTQNSYLATCSNGTYQCKTTENTACTSNICSCSSTNYWNGLICTAKLISGLSCSTSTMCRDYLSPALSCVSNSCACPTGYFWLTSSCVALYSYQIACTSSSQCESTKGLSCPATAGQCNCPTSSTAYKCDCSTGYYWDSSSSQCLVQKSYGKTCTNGNNYECSQSLKFICTGTCVCHLYSTWSGSSCIPQTQTASVCEDGNLVVNCGSPYVINVISGYYGRFDTSTCTPCANCQTGCFTTATSLFSSWFNGQTSLTYKITNGAIGTDPCPNTVKYSQINFQCV